MRKYGIEEPYEKLKVLTRGESLDQAKIESMIEDLDLPDIAKAQIRSINPANYIGVAEALVEKLLTE